MAWTRQKAERLEFLRKNAIPLSLEDQAKVKRLFELRAEIEKLEAESGTITEIVARLDEIDEEGKRLVESLPENWVERLEFTGDVEKLEKALIERQALTYERDCELASAHNQEVLRDPSFLKACEKAGVSPTRRQASKWRLGRRGAALRAAGLVR